MLRTTFASQIGDVDTSARDPLGCLRWYNDNLYRYVNVQNDTATVAGVAGDPVAYDAGGASQVSATCKVVIDLTDADTIPICAGFLTGSVTGTAGTAYYTWIQLTGVVTVPTAITSGVVGNPVKLTTGDKTLAKVSEVDSTGAYQQPCGVEITATAANNKIIAYCPIVGA